MKLALAALLLLALGGCGNGLYCGPGAGSAGARDMLHAMCSEF